MTITREDYIFESIENKLNSDYEFDASSIHSLLGLIVDEIVEKNEYNISEDTVRSLLYQKHNDKDYNYNELVFVVRIKNVIYNTLDAIDNGLIHNANELASFVNCELRSTPNETILDRLCKPKLPIILENPLDVEHDIIFHNLFKENNVTTAIITKYLIPYLDKHKELQTEYDYSYF